MLQESRVQNEYLQTPKGHLNRSTLPETAVQHRLYSCPIHVWYASGWVRYKKQPPQMKWFVYVEYRDQFSASQYHVSEFDTLTSALNFIKNEAMEHELSGICPEQTRKHPIMHLTSL
ncbi:hypothetical protein [Endozoicomonas numazuensis]|uniref:Uncharacterized protein n=1 Tax=Endozoicomonas numazuensis TaxID=1137799 RepID=A0A081N128_9GAMM|nr:hypothetical protein [Endozoicomonas numazuensis]KEQ12151.1 hypothetical protein GZ78_27250 [Endozoicomonas numazuensis]